VIFTTKTFRIMKTEIEKLNEALRVYKDTNRTRQEYKQAVKYLLKIVNRYGTLKPSEIKELTR
jgi:hypothetical protein